MRGSVAAETLVRWKRVERETMGSRFHLVAIQYRGEEGEETERERESVVAALWAAVVS